MLGLGLAVVIFKTLSIRREWRDRMGHLVRTRGWRVVDRSWWSVGRVEGRAEGCTVEVEMPWRIPDRHDRQEGLLELFNRRRRKQAWDYSRLRLTLPRSLGMKFVPEARQVMRVLMGQDLELGDPSFDEVVRMSGNPTALRATFDAPTRWAVRLLIERGGTCDGDAIELSWQHDRSAGRDAEAIDCALEAARALLADKGATLERLARIAAEDPKPGVRLGALKCLVERHRSARQTPDAIRAALGDADPAVRLVAALETGDRAVLEGLVPPGNPPAIRIRAVEALALTDTGLDFLRRVMPRLDGATRAAAVAALKARGGIAVGGLALAETEGGGLALSDPPTE